MVDQLHGGVTRARWMATEGKALFTDVMLALQETLGERPLSFAGAVPRRRFLAYNYELSPIKTNGALTGEKRSWLRTAMY